MHRLVPVHAPPGSNGLLPAQRLQRHDARFLAGITMWRARADSAALLYSSSRRRLLLHRRYGLPFCAVACGEAQAALLQSP